MPWLPGGADSLLLSEQELLGIFGVFLSVLIAVELVETVEVYFKDNEVHAEIVLLVALIALARKVVLLDLGKYDPLTILGIAVALRRHLPRPTWRSSGPSSSARIATPRSSRSEPQAVAARRPYGAARGLQLRPPARR